MRRFAIKLSELSQMKDQKEPLLPLLDPDFATQWIDYVSSDKRTMIEQVMTDFYEKVWTEFEGRLQEYVMKRLNELGYKINSEEEFSYFVRRRISRICFEERLHYYELYLDFVDKENRGTFIGSYSDNVDFSFEGNTVTATIGR